MDLQAAMVLGHPLFRIFFFVMPPLAAKGSLFFLRGLLVRFLAVGFRLCRNHVVNQGLNHPLFQIDVEAQEADKGKAAQQLLLLRRGLAEGLGGDIKDALRVRLQGVCLALFQRKKLLIYIGQVQAGGRIEIFFAQRGHQRLDIADGQEVFVIVNKNQIQIEGIIDPFDVCYGDKDYDLFLLEKGKGKEMGLLDCFFENEDENLKKKIALYSLWNEVKHYYYSKKKNDYSIKSYFEDVRKFL